MNEEQIQRWTFTIWEMMQESNSKALLEEAIRMIVKEAEKGREN